LIDLKKSNILTNAKVAQLKLLPSTTIQAPDQISTRRLMKLATEFGAAYYWSRRPYQAVEEVRSHNYNLGNYSKGKNFWSFRIGRRIVLVDTQQVKLPKSKVSLRGPAYPNEGPPAHFNGEAIGHRDSSSIRERPFNVRRLSDGEIVYEDDGVEFTSDFLSAITRGHTTDYPHRGEEEE